MKRVIIPVMAAFLSMPLFSNTPVSPVERAVLDIQKSVLSIREKKDLLHMREEEKLARDVYLTLYKKWKLPVFKNIAKSESWHMHMIKIVLDKYNLPDPVAETGDRVGVFKDVKLQKLYNQLVSQGERSLIDALKVGAKIEDVDIYDLQKALENTDNKDISIVYQNLEKGSRNHMRAFVGILRRYGSDYTPQFITLQEFNAILAKKHEAGMVNFANSSSNVIEGEVVKVYKLPGIVNKKINWWMIDVKTNNGIVKVAVTTDFLYKSLNIKPGDTVTVKGYSGIYSFVTCEIEDKTSGFKLQNRFKRCKIQ